MRIGEMGQIIGQMGIGKMGVGEMGVNPSCGGIGGWGVKSFFKVQNESVNLPAIIQNFISVVYDCDQLSFTVVLFRHQSQKSRVPVCVAFFHKNNHLGQVWDY